MEDSSSRSVCDSVSGLEEQHSESRYSAAATVTAATESKANIQQGCPPLRGLKCYCHIEKEKFAQRCLEDRQWKREDPEVGVDENEGKGTHGTSQVDFTEGLHKHEGREYLCRKGREQEEEEGRDKGVTGLSLSAGEFKNASPSALVPKGVTGLSLSVGEFKNVSPSISLPSGGGDASSPSVVVKPEAEDDQPLRRITWRVPVVGPSGAYLKATVGGADYLNSLEESHRLSRLPIFWKKGDYEGLCIAMIPHLAAEAKYEVAGESVYSGSTCKL
ncbi:hypothetical protein CSUI_001905 [Cystoisospora suis]|uniref:Uncharacterized protein n=1 Tax=Cystoisospora suis TaxID=483139 RepID=A0A2C6KJL1_9APIC|nr:hypothetical protein CSUI_001905 [Cystoisospora suis]